MDFFLRPFDHSERDYRAHVELINLIAPDEPTTLASIQHRDRVRSPRMKFARYLVEARVEGAAPEVVATGCYSQHPWSYHPQKFHLFIGVHPERRERGVGRLLWSKLQDDIEAMGGRKLQLDVREDQRASIEFFRRRGFHERMRFPMSKLDVTAFDPTPFQEVSARADVEVKTLDALRMDDPEVMRAMHGLHMEILQDIPSPDGLNEVSIEEYSKRFKSPMLLPEGMFFAVDEGRLVGLSELWASGSDELLSQGLTGVARSHRRRGIATTLKLHTVAFAKRYGATSIMTDNEENNPMFALNLALGFEPQPAQVCFEWRREAAAEAAASAA